MAITLVDKSAETKNTKKQNNQEYYNIYLDDERSCVFTPNSEATANVLNTDLVFKIITNNLTNDVLFTATKPRKVNGKVYTNFQVKVKPVKGEHAGKYVGMGFINYYDNELNENSSEEQKALTISNMMTELESVKPEQVVKHLTTADAQVLVSNL